MKSPLSIILRIIGFLALAAGAYFIAMGMFSSISDYRSPLHNTPPAPGQPLGEPATRRLVVVLFDALRADTSANAEVMPVFNQLRAQGASATMHSQPPSFSDPGWATLLTGAWPDINDSPMFNASYENTPVYTQDDVFSAAKRAGLITAVSGYNWFEKLIPTAAVDAGFYTPGEDNAADREVVDAALQWLDDPQYQLVLIHIDQIDYAGHHEGGPHSPNWNAAAARADAMLAEIAAKLDLSQDTLLLVSDHGQIDIGGHGGHDPVTMVEPFVLVGASVKPGQYADMQMVDVAPTIAALLGTNLPASSQGRVLTEMLNLSQTTLANIAAQTPVQQQALLAAYASAIGKPIPADTTGPLAAMQSLRQSRLNAERLPRTLIAIVLALIPFAILIRRPWKEIRWLLAGAALYLLIYNLRWAVLEGRSYSYSALDGQTWLILFTVITGAVSLLVGWLLLAWREKLFTAGSAQAARRTLDLALVTIYLLALPVLNHFALNGLFVTWALPELGVHFLAVFCLVQILIVCAVGLLYAGIAALIARLVRKPVREKGN